MKYPAVLLVLFVMTWIGCATSAPQADTASMVAIEGTLSLRGSEPYTTLVLETNQRNLYVLNMDDMQREGLTASTPKRVRVTGTLYQDTWNGQSVAHLLVKSMLDLASVEYQE